MTPDRWAALRAPFPPEQVRWRVQSSGFSRDGQPWCRVVPFLPAPAIRQRLDEVVTPAGWQLEYRPMFEQTNGTTAPGVVARLAIWADDRWIVREDGSEQSDKAAFKGGLTGAFRRVAAAWGITVGQGEQFAELVERRDRAHPEGPLEIKSKDGTKRGTYFWARPAGPREG